MAYQDRIKQAAYTSPGGTRTEFTFEDLERGLELRGTRYSFPNQEGTFIQGTGSSGRNFPFRVIISGTDYDLQAETFFESLREPGVGRLEHPLYGTIDVVPLGNVTQVDPLKTASGQAVFDVTFWETINVLFPAAIQSLAGLLGGAVAAFKTQFATDWSNLVDVSTQIELVDLISNARVMFSNARDNVGNLVDLSDDLIDDFTDIADDLESSFNSINFDTRSFPGQFQEMMSFGRRARRAWRTTSRSYNEIVDNAIGATGAATLATPTRDGRARNKVMVDYITASNAVADLAASATGTTFTTRPQAIEAAQDLLSLSFRVNEWQEANYAAVGIVDDGASYQQWQETVALAAGYLVELAFSLDQERVIYLDRYRTVIDLTAQLYGEVETHVDFLIQSNNITGDELVEGLPPGRRILYYA